MLKYAGASDRITGCQHAVGSSWVAELKSSLWDASEDEQKKFQNIQLALERILDGGGIPKLWSFCGILETALEDLLHDPGQHPDYLWFQHFVFFKQTRKCHFCSSVGGVLLDRVAPERTNSR